MHIVMKTQKMPVYPSVGFVWLFSEYSYRRSTSFFWPLNRYSSVSTNSAHSVPIKSKDNLVCYVVNIFAKRPGLVYNVTDTD